MRALWVTAMWPDERRPWHGSFVYSQAQSLRRLGIGLDVIYIRGYVDRREYVRGVGALRRALRETEYDLVHAHYGYCGVVGRLQMRLPLIISYCGDDLLGTPRPDGRFSRSSILLATAFAQLAHVATATITKSEGMAARLPRSCRSRNHVIPNGVDLAIFAPISATDARRQLGWPDYPPNVLFVGDPELPRKNLKLAQQVCAELAHRGRPVQLRVGWHVAPSEMPVWMSASDALLFPSLSEGSANTIKEAMAVELPIVSAPVGDVPERLAGIPGTFVVAHDTKAMASALLQALEVGRAPAARKAVEALSGQAVAERVLELYRAAVS